MILDLHNAVTHLPGKTNEERAASLAFNFPGTHLVAFGGVPLRDCLDLETVKDMIVEGLGLSATMTYMNKSGKSIADLASVCVDKGHFWGYRWMTLSILLCGYGPEAELAFARDGNFQLSWPVNAAPGVAFAANGTIREWRRFTKRMYDKSFHKEARCAMRDAAEILWQVLPTDKEQHYLIDTSTHERVLPDLTGKDVLEVGVGHGELTELILRKNPRAIIGYEIAKGVCKIDDLRFTLVEEDIRLSRRSFNGYVLVSNPPYSLLPYIRHEINPKEAILMVPSTALDMFPEYKTLASLPGTAFDPPSKGTHHIIAKGL